MLLFLHYFRTQSFVAVSKLQSRNLASPHAGVACEETRQYVVLGSPQMK